MITPRLIYQAQAAIQEQGLVEQDFTVTSTGTELRIQYKHADFYFLFARRAAAPTPAAAGGLRKAVEALLLPCAIEYKPSLLSSPVDLGYPIKNSAKDFDYALNTINRWLAWIKKEYGPFETSKLPAEKKTGSGLVLSISHLHPTVRQAAGSRFASGQYSDAVEKAGLALEIEVRKRAGQPKEVGGTDLLNRVFSQANPLLMLSADRGEREGYMFLFRGMWQTLRNHHAHNDTATDPARALEWLGFISALCYKLDEARRTPTLPTP